MAVGACCDDLLWIIILLNERVLCTIICTVCPQCSGVRSGVKVGKLEKYGVGNFFCRLRGIVSVVLS